ncbi:MAG TPA: AraC family transcriptional regulator, partial [Victivallales bacterium]|nr:AraC family transcriptional regulator [Victivallales bacterium]
LWRMSSLRPYVRQSGDVWRKKWYIGDRKLLDFLLVCIISGRGVFSVGKDKNFTVTDGDIIWIPPDTLHEMRGTSENMHLTYIHFDLIFDAHRSLWDAHIPADFTDTSKYMKILHPAVNDPFFSSLSGKIISSEKGSIIPQTKEICAIHKLYGNSAILELSAMMLRLLSTILNEFNNIGGNYHGKVKIDEAYRKLNNTETINISVAKIAKDAGFSTSHFRRLFKEFYKISPSELQKKAIMRKAYELLFYEGLNISETAEKLGFKNIHNFSRAFKNYHGKSPKKMRTF